MADNIHPETQNVILSVSEPERMDFLFWHENQGIARRPTLCEPHKRNCRLASPGRKKTLYGRKPDNPLIIWVIHDNVILYNNTDTKKGD